MSSFILPKGTVVKFGTISTSLYQYFRDGIPAFVTREGLELENPSASAEKGIFVGELMAYFSACAAFGQRTSRVHDANQIVLSRFIELVKQTVGEKPVLPGLESVAAEIGLPVILEICLEEACEVMADSHFESAENAEKSWNVWRSVVLKRPAGIPSSWIKKCHFPRLLDFRDLGNGRHPRMIEQTTDAALMVGGLMQSWHKDMPGDLLLAFKKQYGRTNFSQSFDWDATSLERFFNLNGLIDPATRILNQMMIWQDVDALASKQGIPLQ
jgi:hypothetical protein